MTEMQKRFCEEYVKDFNGSAAAIRAGYSGKASRTKASQLLATPGLQSYLSELIGKVQERNEIEVDELVQELKKVAFSDMADFYDENNEIRKVKDIPKDARAALEMYQDDLTPMKFGTKKSRRIKLNSKLDAIEKLMRYLGAYEKDNKQKGEIDLTTKSTDDLEAELAAIRRRRTQKDEEE